MAPCGTATRPAWRPTRPMSAGRAQPLAQRAERPVAASSGGSADEVGQPMAGAGARARRRAGASAARFGLFGAAPGAPRRVERPRPRHRPRRRRSRRVLVLRRGRGAPRSPWRPARRSAGRGRAGRAAAGSSIQASALSSFLRWQDAPPAGLRPADAVGVRRAVDLAGRGESVGVGLAQLERVEAVGGLARAVAGPRLDGVGGRVEQLVEPLDLVGLELREDVVASVADRIADPDPEPAELLGLQLVDDRAQAVVAAVAARLAEPELAERQREVVGDDEQVAERGVLAGEHLAHRQARVVHVGQRLDEGQVEPAVAPADHVRASRWRPRPAQPARSASRSRTSQPMLWRVPAYCEPGFPSPTTTFNDASADSTMWPETRPGATRSVAWAWTGGPSADGTRPRPDAPRPTWTGRE